LPLPSEPVGGVPALAALGTITVKRTAADIRFSKMIRERDGYQCQRCGTVHAPNSFGLHSAHCFSRGKQATRLDPENAAALCYGCHRFIDGHPSEREAFFRARLGDARYEALQLRSNQRKRTQSGG
jgi:hypothetical protein